MNRRRKRRLPFAVYAALTFNMAICIAPFIGARAISSAYGDKRPAFEATSEALTATRQAMDGRFERLSKNGDGAPREVWANYVREQLEANNMSAVRGLLQAAPAMLDGADGQAIKARLAVADQTGDQALLDAAVAYLPEDIQDEYERRSASIVAMFTNTAPAAAVQAAAPTPPGKNAPGAKSAAGAKSASGKTTSAKAAAAPPPAPPAPPVVAAPPPVSAELASDQDGHQGFNVLGDLRDLALTAARWARQDKVDEFAFTLAGVGLILADPEAREGASIALSARRAQQLDPEFELYLERKLYLAAPPQRLKRLLEGEFQSEYGYGTTGPAVVENVFKSSVDRAQLENVLADLRILRDIARDTSAQSAVAILGQVKDGSDLRRAKLVAQAGGDRAVALARYDGDHLLDTARTTIAWTNALKLQIFGLIACLGLLLFISVSVFWRSFTRDRPKRVSDVYQREIYPSTT